MAQLTLHISDRATHAAVVTALEEGGRDLDLNALAIKHGLDRRASLLVRRLARFGDVARRPFYAFASVCVAVISPRARHANTPTTYIMATRRCGQLDYWWIDTADSGFGALGVRRQPLTLREAVVMVARVVRAQARYAVIDGGDRTAYGLDRTAQLRIRSTFYPRLDACVQRRTPHRTRRRT